MEQSWSLQVMKGGGCCFLLHGGLRLKMKQLSLFFVVFVCAAASLLLWNWDNRTITSLTIDHLLPADEPSLSNTPPPQDHTPPPPPPYYHNNTTFLLDKSISEIKQQQSLITTPTPPKLQPQACNFGKGKWVPADDRPLYSGFGCKQWLSGMWACRLTQRTDFGYEKLKWQPKDCKMNEFTRVQFLKRMQHKTLAFVGDSLGRQQFQSLMCMVTGGEDMPDVEDVGKEYGLEKAHTP